MKKKNWSEVAIIRGVIFALILLATLLGLSMAARPVKGTTTTTTTTIPITPSITTKTVVSTQLPVTIVQPIIVVDTTTTTHTIIEPLISTTITTEYVSNPPQYVYITVPSPTTITLPPVTTTLPPSTITVTIITTKPPCH